MSYHTVLPIWNALRERFQKTVEGIPEENLTMRLGETSIGDLLYHTAEVEYMFSEWYFDKPMIAKPVKPTALKEYIQLLKDSNKHVLLAIKELPEDSWVEIRNASFGSSSPLEAVGRLMNHTGMHGGQISFIQKYGQHEINK